MIFLQFSVWGIDVLFEKLPEPIYKNIALMLIPESLAEKQVPLHIT